MEFIVGTVLAGIPIVVEVYDRYWKFSEGVRTFRNYSKELTKLDTIMRVQRVIFRGNVVNLLASITNNQEMARELLFDCSHEKLERLTFPPVCDTNRLESMRETFASWHAMLEQVHSSIETICLEVEGFQANNAALIHSRRSMVILKQISKRFQLCWKKDSVQNSIKELRDFSSDFNELTARITSELRETHRTSQPDQGSMMRQKTVQLNRLDKYRQIRSAAYSLYNIFARKWSCARHQTHAVSISLVDDDKPVESTTGENGMKFGLVVDSEAESPTCRETPICLEVEAANVTSPVTPAHKAEISATHLNNAWAGEIKKVTKYSQSMAIRPKKVKKKLFKRDVRAKSAEVDSLGIASSAPPIMQGRADDDEPIVPTSIIAASDNFETSDSTIDLDMVGDFCRHFQNPPQKCSNSCIGYIKDPDIHRFYLQTPGPLPSKQQKSLSEIITWISEDEFSRNLPRTAVAHIASSLAAAVLQYYSTPWLPDTWQADQVSFFGIGELSAEASGISSTTPYLRVELSKPENGDGRLMTRVAASPAFESARNPTAAAGTSYTPSSTTLALGHNELLFHFGIILLELGYSQPWQRLRQRVLETMPPQMHTDYHVAEKLAQMPLLRNNMGPSFATVLRKCLRCDFGLGETDLANEQLQGLFLVDVLRVLQRVEKGLKELERHLGYAQNEIEFFQKPEWEPEWAHRYRKSLEKYLIPYKKRYFQTQHMHDIYPPQQRSLT